MYITQIALSFLLLISVSTSRLSASPNPAPLSFNQQALLLSIKITPILIGMYLAYEYFEGHHKTRTLIKNTTNTLLSRVMNLHDLLNRSLTQQDEKISMLQQQIDGLRQALIDRGIVVHASAQTPSLLQRLFYR